MTSDGWPVGITWQVYAIDVATLAGFMSDPSSAEAFVCERYADQDDPNSVWLDKSVMGMMEAFGLLTGEASPPASLLIGDQSCPVPGTRLAPLTPSQVQDVARWCRAIGDDEFRDLAGANQIDTDVDYLASYFADFRRFYAQVAARGQATLTDISV